MEIITFQSEKCKTTGWLSNWYLSPFLVSADGTIFYNVEQYMMYHKALLFNDTNVAEKILHTSITEDNVHYASKKIKALGRKVQNFDENVWAAHREKIVCDGLKLKVLQNRDLFVKLQATKDSLLVEAASYDKVWGSGLNAKDTLQYYKENKPWLGMNLLGKCWMTVRAELKSDSL